MPARFLVALPLLIAAELQVRQRLPLVEVPPLALGAFDVMRLRWIIDAGLPGPDRGEGGRYPIATPDSVEAGSTCTLHYDYTLLYLLITA